MQLVNDDVEKLFKKYSEDENLRQRDEFIISLQSELAFFRDESVRLGEYSDKYKKEFEK